MPAVAPLPVSNLKELCETNVPPLHTAVSICNPMRSSCAERDSNLILLTKNALMKRCARMAEIQHGCRKLANIESGNKENTPQRRDHLAKKQKKSGEKVNFAGEKDFIAVNSLSLI